MTAMELHRNYVHFMLVPLKIVGCWDWHPNPTNRQVYMNNIYFGMVLFVLANLSVSLVVYLYGEWTGIMANLDKMADGLPLFVSLAIVVYFAIYKKDLYDLVQFMNAKFKWRSANGLTNMTMEGNYKTARYFAYFYTACTIFSVAMYVVMPLVGYVLLSHPLHPWIYKDIDSGLFIFFVFLRQCVAQGFVALALGQLGVFFACNSILLCGQLDLLCCSLRNVGYTALLKNISHDALKTQGNSILEDEQHSYIYNISIMTASSYHYDDELLQRGEQRNNDIHIGTDDDFADAIKECARVYQIIREFKNKFEGFVSPLLALRVVQVTLYLCTLLYAATLKFDMVTVEYLGAVALDIFVYCYFGNQIILQADCLSTAAYQSTWTSMGLVPRRLILNILMANRKPVVMRAGRFLTMNLPTFVLIIKTSFSYYTLLVNMNEK